MSHAVSATASLTRPETDDRQNKGLRWNNRILVVDDERDIAQAYVDILCPQSKNVVALRSSRQSSAPERSTESISTMNFEVVVAHSVEEALAHVKRATQSDQPFAMGFFDVLLGGESDGFELVRDIHQIDPDLYAVFVTAYNDRSVESISKLLGEDRHDRWDYLNKPFSKGEILQKARNFVTLWNLHAEREQKEEQLAEVQRRLFDSERMASVAAVARGVTHEFGNILMQIMGKADINRNRSEVHMREALEKILDASQRANEILDRFKNLSSGSGGVEARKEDVILPQILDEAIDLMEHQFRKSNVKVCRIRSEKITLKANATSLLQVLVNLSINAVHAMGTSGQIDFSIVTAGDSAEIRVRDYGPGIKPELLQKVLEPFFTTKGQKGTGLGLSICREIVEVEHGGRFTVQNHGVKGLEVVIRLPLSAGGDGHVSG